MGNNKVHELNEQLEKANSVVEAEARKKRLAVLIQTIRDAKAVLESSKVQVTQREDRIVELNGELSTARKQMRAIDIELTAAQEGLEEINKEVADLTGLVTELGKNVFLIVSTLSSKDEVPPTLEEILTWDENLLPVPPLKVNDEPSATVTTSPAQPDIKEVSGEAPTTPPFEVDAQDESQHDLIIADPVVIEEFRVPEASIIQPVPDIEAELAFDNLFPPESDQVETVESTPVPDTAAFEEFEPEPSMRTQPVQQSTPQNQAAAPSQAPKGLLGWINDFLDRPVFGGPKE